MPKKAKKKRFVHFKSHTNSKGEIELHRGDGRTEGSSGNTCTPVEESMQPGEVRCTKSKNMSTPILSCIREDTVLAEIAVAQMSGSSFKTNSNQIVTGHCTGCPSDLSDPQINSSLMRDSPYDLEHTRTVQLSISEVSSTYVSTHSTCDDSITAFAHNECYVLEHFDGEFMFMEPENSICTARSTSPVLNYSLLWQNVETDVKCFLNNNWKTCVDNNSLNIFMLSKGDNKALQRSVVIEEDGKVKVYVHSKILREDNVFWKKVCPLPALTSVSAREMCDRIVSFVNTLREFQVCIGAPEEKLEPLWHRVMKSQKAFLEEGFEETRFKRTLRSVNCALLVPFNGKRCKDCAFLYKSLTQQWSRRANIKDGTPNKKKPDSMLTTLESKARITRNRKNNKNLRLINSRLGMSVMKKIESEGVDLDLDLNNTLRASLKKKKLSPFQELLLESQVRCASVKKKCGMKWHPALIRFALNLKLHSSQADHLIKKYIQLPGERTLFDYSHVHETKQGISAHIVEDIVGRLDASDPSQRKCILSFDEMYISQNIVFNKVTGAVVGYCKLTEAEQEIKEMEAALTDDCIPVAVAPPVAKPMLSFMVRGVFNSVREVVASYGCNNLSKEFLYQCHWDVVEYLEIGGLEVCASVCDGSPINRGFIGMHEPVTKTDSGVIFDTKNVYAYPSRSLYFISDPPHLLKTIRNCLESKARKLQKNNELLNWSTILRLYHTTKNFNLRKAYKLDAQCVFLTPYSRMKVSYAARILSRSVAAELKERGWEGTSELIKFIENVNDSFDLLNGCWYTEHIEKKNNLLAPYTCADDERLEKLDNFFEYLCGWKREVESLPFKKNKDKEFMFIGQQTFSGIEMTIRSFKCLISLLLPTADKLKQQEGKPVKYIMARIFNQDSLEHYFSQQRARCGGKTNPNMSEFLRNQNSMYVVGQVGGIRKRANTKTKEMSVSCDSTPVLKRKKSARCLEFNTGKLLSL